MGGTLEKGLVICNAYDSSSNKFMQVLLSSCSCIGSSDKENLSIDYLGPSCDLNIPPAQEQAKE